MWPAHKERSTENTEVQKMAVLVQVEMSREGESHDYPEKSMRESQRHKFPRAGNATAAVIPPHNGALPMNGDIMTYSNGFYISVYDNTLVYYDREQCC